MYQKLYRLLERYKDIICFKLCDLQANSPFLSAGKNTHIGFDIVNNKITNVKYYFISDLDLPQKYLQISVPRQEYSVSFTYPAATALRWIARPDFESAPYAEHRSLLHLLLKQVHAEWNEGRLLQIADKIQGVTNSKRYPLVGYGASHNSQDYNKIDVIKLYYTLWIIQKWDDPYGRNNPDISRNALKAIECDIADTVFRRNYESVVDTMLQHENIMSLFALDIGKLKEVCKIYFITEDSTWTASVNALHKLIFSDDLNSRFVSLFADVRSLGYRYEEIVYAVSDSAQGIKVYFMV